MCTHSSVRRRQKMPLRAPEHGQLCGTQALWRSTREKAKCGGQGPEEGPKGPHQAGGMPREKQSERKLSRFSCVRLFATPWTAVCQASPSKAFSRPEYWSGLPFPSPREFSQPRDRTQVSRIAGGKSKRVLDLGEHGQNLDTYNHGQPWTEQEQQSAGPGSGLAPAGL